MILAEDVEIICENRTLGMEYLNVLGGIG